MYDTDDMMVHFDFAMSDEIRQYAADGPFLHSRYIFTWSKWKKRYGYCTHCHGAYEYRGYIHGQKDKCPVCQSECTIKYAGLGRSRMIDEAYFVYYQKSILDPNVITAMGIYAVRDYTGDFRMVNTKYAVMAIYTFTAGSAAMAERYVYYSVANTMECGNFYMPKSVYSMYGKYHNNSANVVTACSYDSIREATDGTPFRFSGWEKYSGDLVKYFALYSKYPCVEYLTKMGFDDIIRAKLENAYTYSTINWQGKTVEKILRVSKSDLFELKKHMKNRRYLEPLFLKIFQVSKKDGSNFTTVEAEQFVKDVAFYHFKDLQELMRRASLRKIHNYVTGQYQKNKKEFSTTRYVVSTWKDYIKDCITLEMDLSTRSVLFPRNLHSAHQNNIKKIKLRANKDLNERMIKRSKKLQHLCFQHKSLIIRPIESYEELLEESKVLHHCAAAHYAEGHASGKYILMVIRKASKPNKPYYTAQLCGNKFAQVRGLKNCMPTPSVEKAIKAFEVDKLQDKKSKGKITIPA